MLKRKPSKAERRLERELDAWQELRTAPMTRTAAEIEYIDERIRRVMAELAQAHQREFIAEIPVQRCFDA